MITPGTSAVVAKSFDLYSAIQHINVPAHAHFTSISNTHIACSFTSTLWDKTGHKKRKFYHHAALVPPTAAVLGPALEDDSIALEAEIPHSHHAQHKTSFRRLVLRSVPSPQDKKSDTMKRLVELYAADGSFLTSLNVTDLHGDFYNDEQIGGLAYSMDHNYLAYIAEKKSPGFDDPAHFAYSPDLGERYWGKRPPVLILVKIHNLLGESPLFVDKGSVVPISDSITPAQPFFAFDESNQLNLGFVGYARWPSVLGLAHCHNRISQIHTLPLIHLDENPSTLVSLKSWTPKTQTARNPVVNKDKPSTIAYLSCTVGGPHNQCARLLTLDLLTGDIAERVGVRMDPGDLGLFVDSLSINRGFYTMSTLMANIQHKTKEVAVRVSISDAPNTNNSSNDCILPLRIDSNMNTGSERILAVSPQQDFIVFLSSSLNIVPTLFLLDVSSQQVTEIYQPTTSPATRAALESVSIRVESFSPFLEAIVLFRNTASKNKSPLVIIPHGGPHAGCLNSWSDVKSAEAIGLVAGAGYTVAFVNYTGSSGYGQFSIDALIGKIGDLEVDECHSVAEQLLDNPKYNLDRNNVFFIGGSHSGLIGTCLIGKYPEFYRAVALRNPVTSIGTFGGSDIMDWAFGECGIGNSLEKPALITPAVYAKMWGHSSMKVIHNVVTPTLFLLGSKDVRVPNHQTHEWVAWMHGHKPDVPIRTMLFTDAGHGLDSVDARNFGFQATVAFFEEFRT